MKFWILNCREISRLVSESMDRRLPFYQRVGIMVHLARCRLCARFAEQLKTIRKLSRELFQYREDLDHTIGLSAEAKERIKASLVQ